MPLLRLTIMTALAFAALPAIAADQTVTLAVENMYCAACPHIVSKSLKRVEAVTAVTVSSKEKSATVRYDDAKAGLADFIKATTEAGYPSSPKS
jgi:mercuric ion binding protein